jgi:hypothetical protein
MALAQPDADGTPDQPFLTGTITMGKRIGRARWSVSDLVMNELDDAEHGSKEA